MEHIINKFYSYPDVSLVLRYKIKWVCIWHYLSLQIYNFIFFYDRQYIPKQRQITIDFAAIDAMTGTSVEELLNGN